jgi:hypothetical protein
MALISDSGWDFSIDNRDGQLVLAVNVKRRINASPDWAAQYRHNILAHGTLPKAPYLLMVFPDKFYLWTPAQAQLDQSEPTYAIDARPILDPYFQRAGVSAAQISGSSLELIVNAWLGEILYSDQFPETFDSSQQWLVESGLYAALVGGRFEREAAA